MCILIEQMENQHFTFSEVLDFYENNPDGFGAFDPETGGIDRLPAGDVKAVYKLYAKKYAGKHCLLHFRKATSGAHDIKNVHPFKINDEWALFHNGILPDDVWKHKKRPGKDKALNDTRIYIREYVKPLVEALGAHSHVFQGMVERDIGPNNKLALANVKSGEIVVINREAGVHVDQFEGSWMSNTYAWSSDLVFGFGSAYSWAGLKGYGSDDFMDTSPTDPYVPGKGYFLEFVGEYIGSYDEQDRPIEAAIKRVSVQFDPHFKDYIVNLNGVCIHAYDRKEDANELKRYLTYSPEAFAEAVLLVEGELK